MPYSYRSSNHSKRQIKRIAIAFSLLVVGACVFVLGRYLYRVSRPRHRAQVLAEKAKILLRNQDPEAAAKALEEARALVPDDPQRIVEACAAYCALGDLPRAEEELRVALGRLPKATELTVALAKLLVWTWRPREARELIRPVLPTIRALPEWKGRSEALRVAGAAAAGSGANDEALALLDAAAAEGTVGDRVEAHLLKAKLLVAAWRLSEANVELAAARRLDPDNKSVAVAQALALARGGRPLEAEQALRALYDAGGVGRRAVLRPLGELLAARGQLDQARDLAGELEVEARAEAAYLHASIAIRAGDSTAADDALVAAAKLQPESPRAPLLRATASLRRGDLATARAAYEAALERTPGLPEAELGLLGLDRQAGDPAQIDERAVRLLDDPQTRTAAVCALLSAAGSGAAGARAAHERLSELRTRFPADPSIRAFTTIFALLSDEAPVADDLEQTLSDPNLLGDLAVLAAARGGSSDALEAVELLAELIGREPRFVSARLVLARLYQQLGRLDLASQEVDAALLARPESKPARLLRARYALALGDLDRAVSELGQCRGGANDSAIAQTLAQVRLRQGDRKAAMALLEEVCRKPQPTGQAHAQLARLLALEGDDDAALSHYETARRLLPSNAFVHQDGALLLSRGRLDAAHARFVAALSATGNPAFHAALATTFALRGDPLAALAALKRWRVLQPGSVEGSVVETMLVALCGRPTGGAKPSQAVPAEVLAAASGLVPVDLKAAHVRLELKSFGLWALGWKPEAREQVARTVPGATADVLFLWWGARRLGGEESAGLRVALVQQLLDRTPSAPYLGLDLARIHELAKDSEAELATLRDLRQRFPKHAEVAVRLAQTLERQGARDEARRLYESAVELNPNAVVALNNLAVIVGEDPKQRLAAVDLSRRAVAAAPGSGALNGELLDTLGWLLQRAEQTDEAVECLERAALLRPSSPSIRYHLGAALAAQGKRPRARTHLRTALLAKQFKERAATEALLSTLGANGD